MLNDSFICVAWRYHLRLPLHILQHALQYTATHCNTRRLHMWHDMLNPQLPTVDASLRRCCGVLQSFMMMLLHDVVIHADVVVCCSHSWRCCCVLQEFMQTSQCVAGFHADVAMCCVAVIHENGAVVRDNVDVCCSNLCRCCCVLCCSNSWRCCSVWISDVTPQWYTRIKQSCCTHKSVMPHIWMRHAKYEWAWSHVWMWHVAWIYIYMYICYEYICMYTCIHIYMCTYIYIYIIHMNIYIHILKYMINMCV